MKNKRDGREYFLETMLEITKKGIIKWKKIKNKNYWKTCKGDNWVVFHPADNGCVSLNYFVEGHAGLFNIWPKDKKAVVLGKKLNNIITSDYKKELKALEVKSATLAEIANMFLK